MESMAVSLASIVARSGGAVDALGVLEGRGARADENEARIKAGVGKLERAVSSVDGRQWWD